jgi:hypothetical protein
VALAYYVRLDDVGLKAIATRLLPMGWTDIGSGVGARATVPEWEDFIRSYGTSATFFPESDARTLAVLANPDAEPAVALELYMGAGTLYVIPFHVGDTASMDSLGRLVLALGEAVVSGGVEVLPTDYLADLRLPGEQELLETINQLENEIGARRAEADRFYRYRLLLGALSGDALEELVRDAVGVILEPTDFRVEDPPERFGEDFWITGPDGNFALAEVKGINSGVSRREVNQVDNHREELGHDTTELPGLLVVNVHRKDADLGRRIDERVHPNIVAALRRQNVTLLRSADLYRLLAQRLRGEPAGRVLIDALSTGGGWLEVTDEQVQLHGQGES